MTGIDRPRRSRGRTAKWVTALIAAMSSALFLFVWTQAAARDLPLALRIGVDGFGVARRFASWMLFWGSGLLAIAATATLIALFSLGGPSGRSRPPPRDTRI